MSSLVKKDIFNNSNNNDLESAALFNMLNIHNTTLCLSDFKQPNMDMSLPPVQASL